MRPKEMCVVDSSMKYFVARQQYIAMAKLNTFVLFTATYGLTAIKRECTAAFSWQ
jgi:hypothetical protein